jgi:lipoprotein-releasing system ATP-binding protein
MSALAARSLTKSYPISGGGELAVLVEASLELESGDSAAVLGPSGSGKSTLLAILGTLDRPTSGTLELAGVAPFGLAEAALAAFRSQNVGFVFQDHHLLPQCTVLENVLVPLLANGAAGSDDVERARQLVERVGLAARENHRPAELSGGERQRAALARALIRDPVLLLADEPTGNLDRSTAAAMVELLLDVQRERNAILIAVTHSAALAERMQRRFEIDAGRLIETTG